MKNINRQIASFRAFMADGQNRKTILLIILAVTMLFAASVLKEMFSGARYIRSERGTILGVIREDENETVSFPLRIEADISGEKMIKDVTLTMNSETLDKDKADKDDPEEKSLFDAEVSELLMKLSEAGGKRVMLPATLDDGTELIWRKGRNGTELLMLLMAPLLIWLLYLSGEKKKRDRRLELVQSVERDLPAFNDQLLLMLGSGLVFRDAFRRIADGYKKKTKNSFFEDEIVAIEDEAERDVSDLVSVITRRSEAVGISQFSRLAGVIRDNQLKGVDISGKLKIEGEILWDIRKRNAEERGRLAETKLTLPLAILLMVLVAVTAAPAMIQVKGGKENEKSVWKQKRNGDGPGGYSDRACCCAWDHIQDGDNTFRQ